VLGWRPLFVDRGPPLWRLFWVRWIAESANGLLPLPQMGELWRAKLMHDRGGGGVEAAASVIADVTIGLATQILFTLLGLGLFSLGGGSGFILRGLVAAAVLACFAGSFFALQRLGLIGRAAGLLARWIGRAQRDSDVVTARRLDESLQRVYARRGPMLEAFLWRFAGWVVGAGEIMLILHALGRDIGVSAAIQLESLSQAARVAAFLIPAGLGVQDGALLLVAASLGIGADLALSLSLARRFRELVLGLSGLGFGYAIEARGWRRGRKKEG
jgi:putative membrane protein